MRKLLFMFVFSLIWPLSYSNPIATYREKIKKSLKYDSLILAAGGTIGFGISAHYFLEANKLPRPLTSVEYMKHYEFLTSNISKYGLFGFRCLLASLVSYGASKAL